MGANVQPNLSEYASKLIKHKAGRLVGRFGFTRPDRADIEQDLILHLFQKMPHFNSNRGSQNTFVSRIIKRKVVSIIRHRRALRRDYCRITAIDDAAGGEEHAAIAALVVGESPHDLAIDLAGAIQTFDSDSQRFCKMLMTSSVADAARRLGLTRGAARGRVAILRKGYLCDSTTP